MESNSELLAPRGIDATTLANALSECERIAATNDGDLYRTSQFLRTPAKYHAFIAMYSVMRVVDDLIDNVVDKSEAPLSTRNALKAELDRWEARIRSAYEGRPFRESLDIALSAAARTFEIPLQIWLDFLDAMRFDVDYPRFRDFDQFLNYAEGATVAPTSIAVFLLMSRMEDDRVFRVRNFDYQRCARQLGRFAYIAHILRDFKKDFAVGDQGLLYISSQDLAEHQLTEDALRLMLAQRKGDDRWCRLVHTLSARAREMEEIGTDMACSRYEMMETDCAFILRLIISIYSNLLTRISSDPNLVLTDDPPLQEADKVRIVIDIANACDFVLATDAGDAV